MNQIEAKDGNNPLLIVGALNRSGTNYLADVVRRDSRFQVPTQINEDYLLVYSQLLAQYAEQTVRHWSRAIRTDPAPACPEVLEQFGNSLLRVVGERVSAEKRVLLKCPRSDNLRNAFRLFPRARVILCIRDGRDTVESFMRSLDGYSFQEVADLWARGAREMLEFTREQESGPHAQQILWVRYEDVFLREDSTLSRSAQFCGMDAGIDLASAIDALPLRGSSTDRGDAEQLHWRPVEKPREFRPIGRWKNWSWWRKRCFKRRAGSVLAELGYVEDQRW